MLRQLELLDLLQAAQLVHGPRVLVLREVGVLLELGLAHLEDVFEALERNLDNLHVARF